MGKIRSLPPDVVLKIAAGEVVERPASVAKELMENALDAGSRDIKIDIEAGGRRLIRVTDDGEGMSAEDALLALERHTTSKIASAEDLFAIHTFGFRGEALASIAAVSKMKIITRRKEDLAGFEIQIDGGMVLKSGETGSPIGTNVEVRDLFFNVPARLKFLKSPGTELGHIGEAVARLALANEQTQFQLFHEGRLLAHYPVRAEAAARLAEALGKEAGERMHRFQYHDGDMKISGYAGDPGYDRPNARAIYLFVNRRPVRDRLLYHAVLEAYRTLLPKERNPVVLLFVELPADCVDVNVHPSKGEVKFVEGEKVHRAVMTGIRRMIERLPGMPAVEAPLQEVRETASGYARQPWQEAFPLKDPETSLKAWTVNVAERGGRSFLGQIQQTYLLFVSADGITLVDQHAAHERILVEKLEEQFFEKEISRQLLMIPEVLELSLSEAKSAQEHLQDLGKMGFALESAGERTFWIRGVPEVLARREPVKILKEMIHEISSWGKGTELSRSFSSLIHMLACRAAVQASQKIGYEEASSLLSTLESCTSPSRCPHGRPTVIKITVEDLAKMFGRK